jgi:chemotaxis protein histidine kinase CheA
MAFDEAKFRAEAKAAGYSDADIDAELKTPVAPPSAATESANKATAEMEAEYAKQGTGIKGKYEEEVKKDTTFPVQVGDFKAEVPNMLASGGGLLAAGAATGAMLYGGYKAGEKVATAVGSAANKVYDSLRAKMSSGAQPTPTFAQELATDQAAINQTKTPQTPSVETPKTFEQLQAEYEVLKKNHASTMQEYEANKKAFYEKYPSAETPKTFEELQAEGRRLDAIHEARVNAAQANLPIAPTPENPTVPLTTEVGKAPKEMPMIEQAAGTPEKKAVAEGRKKAAIVPPPAQPSLMTGSGMPAYQGTGPKNTKLSTNIPSLANLPEDKVFVPGGQYMDIIRNATGQEAYTENLKKYGYPLTPQQGYETGRKINESLGRLTREEAKATGAALGEPTKAITEKVNKIKMVKVGGVAGALISLTDLAKADTLRQGLGNVAEGLMPMGIAPSELAPSTLTEKQLSAFREAQKLGSPYRSVPPPR